MNDWSDGVIKAKAAMRRAEHQLAMGRLDAGRESLGEAVVQLTEAIDSIVVPAEKTAD